MLKSMTGFGRQETVTEKYKLTVEMKSVNHRYCDINIRLPRIFNEFEIAIRGIVKEYAERGKIDVFINYEDYSNQDTKVIYHSGIAQGYVAAARQAGEEFGMDAAIPLARLLSFPDVVCLMETESSKDSLYPVLEKTVRQACAMFRESRQQEGANLEADIFDKLDVAADLVGKIERRAPETLLEYRARITAKVEEVLGDRQIDDAVLAAELAVFADKVCVDEETVRLRSHIKNVRETLQNPDSVGRKLDFILQEMNREANTILSKVNDRVLSADAIDLKTEIEKLREQIQNIE